MNKILSRLIGNIHYKIASVILACLFWYIVQGEEILEINRKIQVNISVPDNYMIRGRLTRIKDATLSGSRALLADFSSGPIQAHIDLPKGHIGRLRFRIDKEYIKDWNNRIKLTVHDAYLTVFVDERAEKIVKIKENIQNLPAEGYIIEKTILNPAKVKITGLKSELKQVKHVLSEPLDVADLQKSETFEVGLKIPEKLSSWTKFDIDTVKIGVQIGEQKINKRFSNIPIEIESSHPHFELFPRFVRIEIQGTPGVIDAIKKTELRSFIDIKNLPPGRYSQRIQVKIPANTVLIETFPEQATVDVRSNSGNPN